MMVHNMQQHFLEACQQGNLQDVEKWIAAGVNPLLSESLGLRWAARENHTQVVKYLLPHSDPTAYYSEALRSALCYQNKELIDLLWDHSDVFCAEGEYLACFYQANIFGAWEKVLPIARTQIERIDMAAWAYSLLVRSPKSEEISYVEEIQDTICAHINNEQTIQALSQTIENGSTQFKDWGFFTRLLNHVDDPEGKILAVATKHSESMTRRLMQHPHYKTFIPTIYHHKLVKTVPVLIQSNDLLSLMQVLPYVDTQTLQLYIIEAFECKVPEIWNLIMETKQPSDLGDFKNLSWNIGCRAHLYPLRAVQVLEKFPNINVIPFLYSLAGTPEEHLLMPFLHRCTENDALNWPVGAAAHFATKTADVQALFAKRQNQTLHAHLSDENPNSVSKRM